MLLHYLEDSADFRIFVPSHRMYSLNHQLPLLAGLCFECRRATLLEGFQCFLHQKVLNVPGVLLRHSPDFFKIVGIDMFAETFRNFTFLLLSNAVVSDTVDMQPSLVSWHHITRLEPYFWVSHEKPLVRNGELGAPKTLQFRTSLQRLLTSTWRIIFPPKPLLNYQFRSASKSGYPQLPIFREVKGLKRLPVQKWSIGKLPIRSTIS